MKKLVKLVRLSSKEAFKSLRALGDIQCDAVNSTFNVTNLFLNHISGSSKNREIDDIIERLSSINLVEEIAKKGNLIEVRDNVTIEKRRFFKNVYKIGYSIKDFDFFIVLGKKEDENIILVSIFLNYLE